MLTKRTLLITALTLVATILVGVVVWKTLVFFGTVESTEVKSSQQSKNTDDVTVKGPTFEQVIDEQKNNIAKRLDEEAASLMSSNPSEAKAKYQEAEDAYRDAGNISKASEMDANSMTVDALIQQQSVEQN